MVESGIIQQNLGCLQASNRNGVNNTPTILVIGVAHSFYNG